MGRNNEDFNKDWPKFIAPHPQTYMDPKAVKDAPIIGPKAKKEGKNK